MKLLDILGWESLLILGLIVVNGLLSLAEIALVSSRRSRLQHLAESGDAKARKALEVLATPGRFLVTVVIGVNITAMLAGAYAGAAVTPRLREALSAVPWLAPYAQGLALTGVVVVLTYVQILLGELLPKTLALRHPEPLARHVARPMSGLGTLVWPVGAFLNASVEAVLRLFGSRPPADPSAITSEEIAVMVAQGAREGVFHASQHEMMGGVIEMGERRITTIMTPRPDIAWLDAEDDVVAVRAALAAHPYSRFPVCRGGFDDVVGIVHAKDLLARNLAGEPFDLAALAKPAPVIPDSVPVLKALEAFRASGESMAFVSDEYGSILGLVTLDDVMQSILGDALALRPGDAPRAEPEEEPDAVRRLDGSWLVDGTKPLVEVEELLEDDSAFSEEDEENYQSLGGFVMGRLDRIPRSGDVFESAGWRYEVMDMDDKRVDKVMISRSEIGIQKSET